MNHQFEIDLYIQFIIFLTPFLKILLHIMVLVSFVQGQKAFFHIWITPSPPPKGFAAVILGWTARVVEPAGFQHMGGWKGRSDHETHNLKQHYNFCDIEV